MMITEDDVKFNFWDDDDFDKELGFDMEDFMEKCEQKEKPQCIVHCYMEDWETAAIKDQKNIVGQTKLLKNMVDYSFLILILKKWLLLMIKNCIGVLPKVPGVGV